MQTQQRIEAQEIALRPFGGPAAWKGCEIANSPDIHCAISADESAEIMLAVQATIQKGLGIANINRANFALPLLGRKLTRVYDEVVYGRGFVLMHGMPVDETKFTRDEIIRAYIGVGAWLGEPVSQNYKGHIVGHVKDIGADSENKQTRIYTTAAKQPYHTDSADIVGLLCLKPSNRITFLES